MELVIIARNGNTLRLSLDGLKRGTEHEYFSDMAYILRKHGSKEDKFILSLWNGEELLDTLTIEGEKE